MVELLLIAPGSHLNVRHYSFRIVIVGSPKILTSELGAMKMQPLRDSSPGEQIRRRAKDISWSTSVSSL